MAEQAKGTADSRMTSVSDVACSSTVWKKAVWRAEAAGCNRGGAGALALASPWQQRFGTGDKRLTVAPSRSLMMRGVKKVKPLRQHR